LRVGITAARKSSQRGVELALETASLLAHLGPPNLHTASALRPGRGAGELRDFLRTHWPGADAILREMWSAMLLAVFGSGQRIWQR